MNKRKVFIWLVPAAILALLALIFIPRLLGEEKPPEPAYWPTTGWRTGTPEEQSLDSAKLAEGLQSIQRQDIKIDSLMIIRNGSVVLDAYFHDPYDGAFPHDMASVTKSVMTTLIGIAVDQGKIQIDQPMVSFFPDRTIANLDDRKKSITVGHLASMTNGFESGCLADDMGTLDRMRSNSDWVQATLDRKMAQKPGKSFCYDSPGMHLLSAILQESTGMTALEFAQQNLFEPLGIHEVIWESDPQGYTHGWGDLHMKPEDAAKLGYLWLNNGVWDGKQIVSTAWVKDSVKVHSDAGYDEYGYGWWISDGGYFASGRGGQNIKVVPALNAIVVTTGGGFEYDEIDPYLLAAIVDPSKPLPANPEGVAKLDAALADLEQPLPPLPVGPLPDSAKAFLGKTYVFAPNQVGLETMMLEFNDSAEATMYLKLQGSDVALTIGLDGKYRLSPDGSAQRGYWEDPQTFVAEVFDVGLSTRRLHFQDDRIVLEIPGMRFEGQVEKP